MEAMRNLSPKRTAISRHESDSRKILTRVGKNPEVRVKKVAFADVSVIVIADASYDKHNPSKMAAKQQEEEILTPKERRRRKAVMAVACTTFLLLTASALFVLITLFNASAIDEAVRRENENSLQAVTSSNGEPFNSTVDLSESTIEEISLNALNISLTTLT